MLGGGLPAGAATPTATAGTGSISGKVSAVAGVDVTQVLVIAVPETSLLDKRSVRPDADGEYTLKDLMAGNYWIQFAGRMSGAYDTWYGGPTPATAKLVAVGANQVRTGIDVKVPLGATVSGTVTLPDGISDRRVTALTWPDNAAATG